ncbi:hypothetical protein [Sediminimonas sp.]|uniref:hypothetical protein n=1 Tax=Sediminimonas sp. TaxID=2823379 RepID=UPI0025ED8701|nr:hypothetical protein [Sediminimonas sp.]
MRQPTSEHDAQAWWRAALRDPKTPRHDGDPKCGFYRMRKRKGGPWLPVEITLDQDVDFRTGELAADERVVALVEGIPDDAARIWTYLTPITREEFERLFAARVAQTAEDRDTLPDLTERAILP